MQKQLAALIEREEDGYVSLYPELDVASQGDTIEEARENLREALELFFETASPEEIQTRLHDVMLQLNRTSSTRSTTKPTSAPTTSPAQQK